MPAAALAQPRSNRLIHRLSLSAFGVLLLCAGMRSAPAADNFEASYRAERAACAMRQDNDREACLREAAAARQAGRQGQLKAGQADYQKNALQRCTSLPAAERDSCERRARGEGASSGSVEGGGIIREYREVVLPPAPPPQPAPAPDLNPPAAQGVPPAPVPQAPAGTMLQTR